MGFVYGDRARRWMVFLCVAGSLGVSVCAAGPPSEPAPRPRVAVALGGGAALGLAHVGVLRWMEEHQIPIDAMVGTSMGGLVGGLYATGYSADEIEEFVLKIDWQRALESGPRYTHLSYRRKQDRREVGGVIEFGLRKGKVSMPSGLSPGNGVGLVLSSYTAPYGSLDSFDALPTPFRCTAVDLISGDAVLFSKGSLFDALRSTMSIPGYFSPWKVDNRILVDGGVLNNLPTDIAKGMGVDVVVGVELESPPFSEHGALNLFGVASRSLSIMISNAERRNMALADVLVMPDLRGFSSADYPRATELIEKGYQAAQNKARSLLPLALPDAEWKAYIALRESRRKRRPEQIRFVQAEGVADKYAPLVARRAQQFEPVAADPVTLGDALSPVTENGTFASADYSFVDRDGQPGLNVRLHEKQHGPPFVRLGLLVDGNQRDGAQFGVQTRFILPDLPTAFSELRVDLSVGGTSQAGAEYYWRPHANRLFFAPLVFARTQAFPVYAGHYETARVTAVEGGGGADVGLAVNRNAEVRLGYVAEHSSFRLSSGTADLPNVSGTWHLIRARLFFDGQDAAVIPSRGIRASLRAEQSLSAPIGLPSTTTLFEGTLSYAMMLSPKYRLLGRAAGGWTGHDSFLVRPFLLGGEFGLYALARNQMLGNRYYYASDILLRPVTKGSQPLYAAIGWEAGRSWFTGTAKPVQDGILGVATDTPLGAILAGFAIGTSGERKLIFHLGRTF